MQNGVLTICIGPAHARFAGPWAESLRRHYAGPVCVVTDQPPLFPDDFQIVSSRPFETLFIPSRSYKLDLPKITPFYGVTAFFDIDGYFHAPIDFDVLTSDPGIAMAQDEGRPRLASGEIHHNSGAILFRRSSFTARAVFRVARGAHDGRFDQPAFAKAFEKLRQPQLLPQRWNSQRDGLQSVLFRHYTSTLKFTIGPAPGCPPPTQ